MNVCIYILGSKCFWSGSGVKVRMGLLKFSINECTLLYILVLNTLRPGDTCRNSPSLLTSIFDTV